VKRVAPQVRSTPKVLSAFRTQVELETVARTIVWRVIEPESPDTSDFSGVIGQNAVFCRAPKGPPPNPKFLRHCSRRGGVSLSVGLGGLFGSLRACFGGLPRSGLGLAPCLATLAGCLALAAPFFWLAVFFAAAFPGATCAPCAATAAALSVALVSAVVMCVGILFCACFAHDDSSLASIEKATEKNDFLTKKPPSEHVAIRQRAPITARWIVDVSATSRE
jgi:hypothetical protein